ncbi:hypothetical protein [Sulfitobacter sp. MF3-043]|uniref:hypothetical protein n=1 Tax=Sulfitobacter sediminivivens TaxID=3252902 RepID=UPI0036DCF2CE
MISNKFMPISLKAMLVAGCATVALVTSPMVTDVAYAQQGSGKQMKGGSSAGGARGGGQRSDSGSGRGQGLGGIFRDITGMDDDAQGGATAKGGASAMGGSSAKGGTAAKGGSSKVTTSDSADASDSEDSDRPEWAGQPGGKDGAGGGQPPTSGSKKGDLFGDLWIIARDDNGVPILTPEGYVQPLDVDGNLIALDEEGHPVDETLTQEVELGRLNVGRAPVSVLDRRAEEVITLLNEATDLKLDASGRLVLTLDGIDKTIDSPLENLAIYVALMTDGTIPGVDDLPGTAYDFMVDGTYTSEDLAASVAFLAAATDKTGVFTSDEIAYINAFLGINTTTNGDVTYSVVDYSAFSYDREDTFGDRTVVVLLEQTDGSFVPTEINVYETIFGSVPASDAGSLDAFTLAADDSRTVLNFVHEYEVPVLDASQ